MTDEKFKREEIERIFRLVRPRLSLEFTDQEIYDELEKGQCHISWHYTSHLSKRTIASDVAIAAGLNHLSIYSTMN